MAIEVGYGEASYRRFAPSKFVKSYVKKVCDEIGLAGAAFGVSFVSSEDIRALNLKYRGIDAPTDILSFAAMDDAGEGEDFILPGRMQRNLGDMYICIDELKDNAARFSVSEDEELRRLLIHGVLHLSGRDHMTNEPGEPMLALQEEILKKLGN